MIADTSSVLAILFQEPEADRLSRIFEQEPMISFPASCYLEAVITLMNRRGDEGLHDLDFFLACSRMRILPFNEAQTRLAREAFRRFGKGRHKAGLNFGDCISYAASKETGEPLLFKGTDFGLTDVEVAAY